MADIFLTLALSHAHCPMTDYAVDSPVHVVDPLRMLVGRWFDRWFDHWFDHWFDRWFNRLFDRLFDFKPL